MIIVKPYWVDHHGTPIFSIDVHPDGKRVATCGGDSNIKIWNIEPISDELMEEDADDISNKRTATTTAKLLYSINYAHSKSINSIKWSKDGRYLASVSDDRECIVWTLSPFQSTNTPEIWTSVVCLKGHCGDITDVIWSPDNQLLATCSLDKTILIWETTKFGIIKKLEKQEKFINGITWDPMGKYLISQSDGLIYIWNTINWNCEKVIKDVVGGLDLKSFFLRSSWTPDSKYFISTQGFNKNNHSAILIGRDNFINNHNNNDNNNDNYNDNDDTFELVGHMDVVSVSKCSPIIFKDNSNNYFSLILLGSVDSTFSLWLSPPTTHTDTDTDTNTNNSIKKSPPQLIMVCKEVFKNTVQDVSWCPDGLSFFVCSIDGTIAYISLKLHEISDGSLQPISHREKQQFFKKSYDFNLPNEIELFIHKRNEKSTKPITRTTQEVLSTQKLSTTLTGKKRITPLTTT
ncbi:hypothetical protein ACTFIY_005022 [Dictyostelium cf. discoideum]